MLSEPPHFAPTSDRLRDLRRALGCFGTGVTVITTQTDEGPLGITANSFSSVSLEPPLVLWSPAVASRRHAPFVEAERFCIHVLSADQLDLARHFASKGDGFEAFDWSTGPLGAPRLSGCLAEFHCSRYAVHPAGDHSMILGEVRHVFLAEGDAPGLLFKRGQFGHFAPEN
ncbi:flavin reductase family protein [uncultured Roseobacter sp.]|uniref:flavin reductase family protein n=1 Tax=uncultured Roseobacter sp. TaxID=114847 RepID=UPI00261A4292|nr:flavin reductase family protein [uncultured Roseobacter sp.]